MRKANDSVSRQTLTRREMMGDFHYLFEVIRNNYPFLWSKARFEGYDWITHRADFEGSVSQADSDGEFAAAIYRAVRSLNNGHTILVGARGVRSDLGNPAERWAEEARKTTPERAGYWAELAQSSYDSGRFSGTEPFAAVYVAGDYVVAGASPDPRLSEIRPGWKVIAVNELDVHEFVRGYRGRWWLKYDPLRGRVYLQRLTLPDSGQRFVASFETAEGSTRTVELPSSVDPWANPYTWPPQYAGQRAGSVVYTAVVEGRVGYVQIRQMGCGQEDMQSLGEFMAQARTLPGVVIDIRGNSGGSDLFWMQNLYAPLASPLASGPAAVPFRFAWRSGTRTAEFLESKIDSLAPLGLSGEFLPRVDLRSCAQAPAEIRTDAFAGLVDATFPLPAPDGPRYSGKVFVLVDDGVFSSSETFAAFCRASGWATLVGECTGGDGIGFDASSLALPSSGMYILYSTTLGLNPDWTVNEQFHTAPDVLVERSPDDLLRYIRTCRGTTVSGPDPSWDKALAECLRRI